jgi:hypothetical protein
VSIRDLMTSHRTTARAGETIRGAARLIDAAHGKVLLARERDGLFGVLPDWDVISAAADGGAPEAEFVRNDMLVKHVAVMVQSMSGDGTSGPDGVSAGDVVSSVNDG